MSNDTTDFFDTHKSQCDENIKLLEGVDDASELVAKLQASIALCDAAIARGRRRSDMPAVVDSMREIKAHHDTAPAKLREDLRAAREREDDKKPYPDGSYPRDHRPVPRIK